MKAVSLPLKLFILLVLMLILLLPVANIMNLIDERAASQEEVVKTVSNSTSGPQTLVGPILAIPYEVRSTVVSKEKGREEKVERFTHYELPDTLDVRSKIQVDPRKIGIYQAQTYVGPVSFNGKFTVPALPELQKPSVKIGQPYLSVSIGDPRGIRNIKPLRLNGVSIAFKPGTGLPALEQGIHAPLTLADYGKAQPLEFNFEVELQGTNSLAVAPVGESSRYFLSSNWPNPSFGGDFLPTTRTVNTLGFTAEWKSTWFANSMNTRLLKLLDTSQGGTQSLPLFSTGLIQTVDQYQLNQRSVKYAVLFIGLTFMVFFLFEVLKGLRVHPVQYALVGMALCLFYLLLLALSEHTGFNIAYLIASGACVSLITFYVSHVLRSVVRALSFGALLALLYAALWGLLQSEDNALLLGSGLLFCTLAVVMVVTRKLDWYKVGSVKKEIDREDDNNPPPRETLPKEP